MAGRFRQQRRILVGVLHALSAAGLVLALALASCGRKPDTAEPEATLKAPEVSASAEKPRQIVLSPRMLAVATRPAGVPTGLFLDRPETAELRVVSYNVNWDKIFPDKDLSGAEKFQRVVKALDPDILNLQEIKENSAADTAALMNAISPLPDGGSWHAHKGWTNVIVSKFPLTMSTDRTVPAGQRELAIALVDLPDQRYAVDVYVLNNHFKCCGGKDNDPQRQQQSDALVSWIRDARTVGGEVDLSAMTPLIIAGDLNIVGGPRPLDTLITGDIADEQTYGGDCAPDWDDSELTDAHPLHNAAGPDDYTWRNDNGRWDPGRLDYVIYSDSVLEAVHAFVLNTTIMSDEQLTRAGLEKFDVTLDMVGAHFDHLPLVVDFRLIAR